MPPQLKISVSERPLSGSEIDTRTGIRVKSRGVLGGFVARIDVIGCRSKQPIEGSKQFVRIPPNCTVTAKVDNLTLVSLEYSS